MEEVNCSISGPPKWTFIMYLAILGRLYTRDRFLGWGIVDYMSCPMCGDTNDTIEHLLYQCTSSHNVWTKLLQWQGITRAPMGRKDEVDWASNLMKGKSHKADIQRVVLAGSVYHIWMERNQHIFKGTPRQPEVIVRQAIQEVFHKSNNNRKFCFIIRNYELVSLNILFFLDVADETT